MQIIKKYLFKFTIMSKPEFYIAQNNQAEPDSVFVLHTEAPYYIGRVMNFRSSIELNDFIAKRMAIDGYFMGSRPDNYNILIILAGALESYKLEPSVKEIYTRMAEFYLNEKIKPNERYYSKKFLDRN